MPYYNSADHGSRSVAVRLAPRWRLLMAIFMACSAIVTPARPQSAPAGTQRLQGHLLPDFAQAPVVGTLDGATRLDIAVSLPVRSQSQLATMVQAVTEPQSPQYRKFLSPSQFDAQFAPTDQDYAALTQFAHANGLTVVTTYPSRMVLDLEGSVSAIQQAFHVTLATHRRSDGSVFYALDREPSLDLATPVLHVSGLDNFRPPRRAQTGSGFNGTFTGQNLRNAYLPGVTEAGEGQTVGLIEFDGFYTADPQAYENLFGLTVPIDVVTVGSFSQTATQSGPGGNPGGNQDGEVAGDIQMAMAIAPQLSLIVVYEGSTLDSVLAAASSPQNGVAPPGQLSMSWTTGTDSGTVQLGEKMALQGETFL
jgi:subtilase family serine protease